MDLEAEYDETNGWKRYIPSVVDEEDYTDVIDEETEVPVANALERKRRRR